MIMQHGHQAHKEPNLVAELALLTVLVVILIHGSEIRLVTL
jgi:hypothetical protein